jgi:hypothetical protein
VAHRRADVFQGASRTMRSAYEGLKVAGEVLSSSSCGPKALKMKTHYYLKFLFLMSFLMIKPRRMSWIEHVACMGVKRNVYVVLVGKPEGKRTRKT